MLPDVIERERNGQLALDVLQPECGRRGRRRWRRWGRRRRRQQFYAAAEHADAADHGQHVADAAGEKLLVLGDDDAGSGPGGYSPSE